MSKLKNKKYLITILAVFLVAGFTFAYFQSSASFVNIFNTGTYRVVTTEEFVGPENWAPGQEIPKTITSTNEGTIPAAVRVSYTEQWLKEIDGVETDITSQVSSGTVIINLDNTNDWIQEGNYYYYKYILKPTETTTSFIRSVTLDSNINGATCVMSQDGLTQTCESNNPALEATYKLTITKETVQADKYSEWNSSVELTEKPQVVTILSGTKGNLQPGDVVGIGDTEDFFVISSDNSPNGKTVLFAKYNLLVGSIVENSRPIGLVPTTTPGYGLQDESIIGYDYDEIWNGEVDFSNTNYWMDGDNLALQYDPNHEVTIYTRYGYNFFKYISDDTEAHIYVYDSNSLTYPYVNEYVERLKEIGAPSTITGRLLSYEEAKACENVTYEGTSIIGNGRFSWLGSVNGEQDVDMIDSDIVSCILCYNSSCGYGVRPAIEIYTSDIN